MKNENTKKILENKVSNLITVNSRDSSIFTRLNSQHISISNYANNKEINNFFTKNQSTLNLYLNINIDELNDKILSFRNSDELLSYLNEKDIALSLVLKKEINKNFNLRTKNLIIDYTNKNIINFKNKIINLKNVANKIRKDKGSWNLYMTKFFLKGETPYKKTIINAPLMMIKVDITFDKNQIYINKLDDDFVLNEKVIVFLQRDIEKQLKNVSEYHSSDSIDVIKKDIEKIIEKKIEITKINNNVFLNESSSEIKNKNPDLIIEDGICFGIFEPGGGKLFEELLELIKNKKTEDIFNKSPKTTFEEIQEREIDSEALLQIDKLDLYQKLAVRASLIDNTIIHGPPGTGKSEVISNIIANIIFNQKNILMVSEKKAALEVLSKRLKFLNIFMLSIYDINDKKTFFDSIKNLSNFLGNSWVSEKYFEIDVDEELEKINVNFQKMNNFSYNLKKFSEFEQFKNNNLDFKDFLEKLNEIGGIDYLLKIINENIIDQIEEFLKLNGLSIDNFFTEIKKFNEFINNNNLNDQNDFDDFIKNCHFLLKCIEIYKIDLNDRYAIQNCLTNFNKLSSFLKENLFYQKILKENSFKFYEDINEFKSIKNKLIGLIDEKSLNNLNSWIKSIRPFLNRFDSLKKSNKKYAIDNFVKNNIIVEKKPFTKFFYSKNLTSNDELIIKNLTKINELNLDEYEDFQDISKNQELFYPLNILYFFNKNIIDKKYIDAINNKSYIFNLSILSIVKDFNLNLAKFLLIKNLAQTKKIYDDQFPEFISTNLFSYFVKENKEVNWNNFSEIIAKIVRKEIVEKLFYLSKEEKEIVEKAFHVSKLERRPSINDYMEKFLFALKIIFPIWVSRPEQVSMFVPFEKNFFNYGIYDEASQMFLERAYSLLYRSEINIIAGDEKQLKPSNFFVSRNEDRDEDYEIDDLDNQESLLDRSISTSWTQVMLKNHYRSDHKELISFSSEFLYNKELNYASKNGLNKNSAIEVIDVNGLFEERVNKKEANEIVEILNQNAILYKNILVITFNRMQEQLISNMLLDKKIVKSEVINKLTKGEIEIINIENVQGNEAELVILSICYGRKNDNDCAIKAQFGPIIQDGGKNRLNVAITRAKSKMIVVKSLSASDIKDSSTNDNLMTFKKFLSFLDKKNKENVIDIKMNKKNQIFDSKFEQDVFDNIKEEINNMNLSLVTQYEVGNKKIDIAIVCPKNNYVILGIEVDGWKYHRGTLKKIEDIERQSFLESRGYKIFRVFEHEWKYAKDIVLKDLFFEIDFLVKKNDLLIHKK